MLEEQPIGIGKKWTLEHSWATEGFEFKKPETSTGTTKEKGEDFILDPMVTKGSTPQDYSASVSDTVSLVGKESMMGGPSPRGFMSHTVGVGQMKLEAPPRYSGKKQPSVQTWLSQMEQYMRLMKYAPTDWLDVVAMRVDGAYQLLG